MHPNHYAILALDLAHDRVREAERHYRYRDALRQAGSVGIARRSAARVAASISRAAAGLAERLDGRSAGADGRWERSSIA